MIESDIIWNDKVNIRLLVYKRILNLIFIVNLQYEILKNLLKRNFWETYFYL